MNRIVVSFSFLLVCACAVAQDALSDAVMTLALKSDAVVIAHVGASSTVPIKDDGAVALWIDLAMKGKLQGGKDIIWIPGKELPKAAASPYWLLFLVQEPGGKWHAASGVDGAGPVAIKDYQSDPVPAVKRFLGSYGPAAPPEPPSESEIDGLIRKAANGGQDTRNEAFLALLSAGDGIRQSLANAAESSDNQIAAVGRTLLPLMQGGPVVNNVRLALTPSTLELRPGESKVFGIHLANRTELDIRIVTGVSTRGDNVSASAAYEIQKVLEGAELGDKPTARLSPVLRTTLPKDYGVSAESNSPLPLLKKIPSFATLDIGVEVNLQSVALGDGKKETWVLSFPQGHVEMPGPGTYLVRVRFDCPGPRADQPRLVEQNYWAGGQLLSNDIKLILKEREVIPPSK
jgi:hypothetical protein